MHELFSRRDVIKTLLVVSATSIIENKVWAGKVVSEVKAKLNTPTNGIARIVLSSFPALSINGGSVRLGSSDVVQDGPESILPRGLWYPIIINRVSATEYVALESACTHAGCVVNAYNSGSGRITCDCHGSQFDIRGARVAGPAAGNLLRYQTILKDGVLIIILPDQGYDTLQDTVLNGSERRLELRWTSYANVEYEVRYRPNTATEPVVVNFATTPTGATTQNMITGNDTLDAEVGARKVYVVPQNGIYQIAMRLRQV